MEDKEKELDYFFLAIKRQIAGLRKGMRGNYFHIETRDATEHKQHVFGTSNFRNFTRNNGG